MSSKVQGNNKGKKIIKDPRQSSGHTLLLYFIIYQLPCMPPPNMLQTKWLQSLYLEEPKPEPKQSWKHPGKILGTQIAMEKINYHYGEGI